jgi:DtxR family transcriptional regulator, Mn-dependent transcriptional regulator
MVGLSGASEDYLKAMYHIAHRGEAVTTGLLAAELGVASPSVTAMIKRLQEIELVDRAGPRELRLTGAGERAALRVVRRHRLLETFLAQVLDVPWDEVHAEAELLEHVLSERLEERIDAALGHPTHDPHGDPIPPRHGAHDERWGVGLDAVPAGARFRVRRVSDRDSAALRHLGELGVRPGVVVTVERQDPFGGPLWVRIEDRNCALGVPLTRLVHGDVLDEETA